MSKFWHKICLALVTIMMMGLLTGCSAGSTVDTVLTINKDLSGSRVMTLVVDQSVYDEYFTGTVEQLNALITEKCPSQITWVYDDSTGVMIYTFTLNFTSPTDYKTQVDAIIGEGSDVELTITQSDSVWATGVYVEEGFSSSDLLQWLTTAIVDAGYVSSSNSSKLFTLGDNTVVFAEQEYSSYDSIYVDEIEYVYINSIDLLTDASAYDSYKKTIVMSIPEESMEVKGDEIKSFLAAKVPAGATAEWTTEDTDSVYTVSKSGMTAEDLETFLNEFFATDLCTVTQMDIRDNMSPFSFNVSLTETVDYSNYLIGQVVNRADINYYVKGENGYVGGRYLDSLAYYEENDDVVSDYEGYRYGQADYDNELLRTYRAYFQKIYRVSDVSIESGRGLFGGLNREIVFTLAGEPTEEEQETILEKINALLPSEEETETDTTSETTTDETESAAETESVAATEGGTETEVEEVEVKADIDGKAEEGNYIVTIKQSGNREEIKASSEALFGYTGDMYLAKKFHFTKLNYEIALHDQISLGDFVDYVTEDATSTYVLNTGFASKIESSSIEEGATIKNNTLTIENSALSGVSVVAYGSQFNFWALFFYIFVIIFIACAVILLYKFGIIAMIMDFIKSKTAKPEGTVMAADVTQGITAGEAPQIEETQTEESQREETQAEESPMFCENCGAKRDADALVCTECGTKFED